MARRYDSGDAKRRILAACVRLFLEKGYTNTKVAEILKEADVSAGSFQNIFHTKDGVLTELVGMMFGRQFGAVKSLAALEQKLQSRGLHPLFLTGHTGWTDNFEFSFAHKDKLCSPFQKRVPDPTAPYDAYDESDDTEEAARAGYLQAVVR